MNFWEYDFKKSMKIIEGKKIQEEILTTVEQHVRILGFQPVFSDVVVGDEPTSLQYVRMKARMAEKVGIHFHNASYPANITTEELIKEIEKLNLIENMCGIIVQLPLPETIDRRAVLDAIDPRLDVDCLSTSAGDKFYGGDVEFGFPAALACMFILDSLNLDLTGKNIVVVGQGELVGKPVTQLLRLRRLNPDVVTSETSNTDELLKKADVIISGTGQGKFITGEMVKPGVVIIDAGTSESNSGIVGDVDLASMEGIASVVSPVPGGVGPVTVAMLLNNVLKVAQHKYE
jgi:methylenetetrahydrofolate dehydrogenase (NADP+)/methenyltetrahydrofolate cyclohydrolase